MTGTWVAVGPLRAAVVGATMPLVSDAVVTGADRAFLGLLAWPNVLACRELLGAAANGLSTQEVVRHSVVREAIHTGLARYNGRSLGSSTRIVRALLLDEPPSAEANEITDKGYVNQSAVLSRRSADVDRLYAAMPDEQVLIVAS